jgi:hypothetical protein
MQELIAQHLQLSFVLVCYLILSLHSVGGGKIHITLHYIALHYITLHYITIKITLHYITSQQDAK